MHDFLKLLQVLYRSSADGKHYAIKVTSPMVIA